MAKCRDFRCKQPAKKSRVQISAPRQKRDSCAESFFLPGERVALQVVGIFAHGVNKGEIFNATSYPMAAQSAKAYGLTSQVESPVPYFFTLVI